MNTHDSSRPSPQAKLNPTELDYQSHSHSGGELSSEQNPHATVSLTAYLTVWVVLMVLLAVTVGAAFIHMGPFNLTVALLIAFIKAILVILIFMHVKVGSRLVKIFVVASFVWLGIMFVFTFADYATRSQLPMSSGWLMEQRPLSSGWDAQKREPAKGLVKQSANP